jgi:hypothetical protein
MCFHVELRATTAFWSLCRVSQVIKCRGYGFIVVILLVAGYCSTDSSPSVSCDISMAVAVLV